MHVHLVARCQSNTLDNLQVESMQSRNVRWCVRQQSNFLDTKIAQHLATEPHLPEGSFRALTTLFIRHPCRLCMADFSRLAQVYQCAASLLCNSSETLIDELSAVARCAAKDVSMKAMGVDTHENRCA